MDFHKMIEAEFRLAARTRERPIIRRQVIIIFD
jgi:hypothetical protein